jgi:hypothetical protein
MTPAGRSEQVQHGHRGGDVCVPVVAWHSRQAHAQGGGAEQVRAQSACMHVCTQRTCPSQVESSLYSSRLEPFQLIIQCSKTREEGVGVGVRCGCQNGTRHLGECTRKVVILPRVKRGDAACIDRLVN